MITHRIVVHTPPVYTPPPPTVYTTRNNAFKTQEEYDDFLNKVPFNEWDFVTLVHGPVMHLHQLHRITRIERDFNKLIYSRAGAPNFIYVLSLNMMMPTPWVRWDNTAGYRLISHQEFEQYIKPNSDKLQDHCKQYG